MKLTDFHWSSDLLVSCKMNQQPVVYINPIDKLQIKNHYTDPDLVTIGTLPIIGTLYDLFTSRSELKIFEKFPEGYYDKNNNCIYKGKICKGDEILNN